MMKTGMVELKAMMKSLTRALGKVLGTVTLTVAVSALAACGGVGSQEDSTAAQVARDSRKIQARYDIVAGTYQGQISNPASGLNPIAGTLFMYVVPIVDGKLADGSAKIRPELRARFRLDKIPAMTDITTMVGDYDDAGNISCASASGGINPIQLSGQMLNGNVEVQVSHQGGVWGTFTGSQVSKTASAPAEGDVREEYERYRLLFHEVEGTYTAVIKMPKGKGYGVEIVVSQKALPTVTTAGTVLFPALVAHYKRLDVIQGQGIGEYTLTVDYDGLTHDVVMQSASPDKAIPGSAQVSVVGKIENHALNSKISDKTGFLGYFQANAKNIPPLN